MSDPKDESITHVFDQTNGVIDDLDGDSDGTAASDTASAADRGDDGAVPGEDAPQAYDGPLDGAASARQASTSRADDASDAGPRPEVLTVDRSAQGEPDYAPEADLPLPGDGGRAADEGAPHTYAVDARGTATDEGRTGGAGEAVRADRSEDPVDDASHTGRLADAYATGPTEEAARGGSGDAVAAVAADHGTDGEAGRGEAAPTTASDDTTGGADRGSGDGTGLAALADESSVGHVFDQTNGVIQGLDGDSDGTAISDEESAADRRGENEPNPVGQQDAWHDDHYGEADGKDPNP